MRWKGRRVSTNVEDRRGGGGVKAGGISIIGLVVAFIAWKFFGVDPQQAYQATQAVTSETTSTAEAPQNLTLEQKEASEFGLEGKIYNSVSEAYEKAMDNASSDDFIYVGGSTFVVAEIL